MKVYLQKVTPAERQVLWKNVIDDFTGESNQSIDGIFAFQSNTVGGNRHLLFEGIRSYGENERDDPATAGVGDAPRKKMDDDCFLEDYYE